MALANYSDLKSAIASYLARSDLTSQIPDFIRLAEIRLRRELRIRQMLKNATTATTSGDSTVGLPSDFLELRDIFIQDNPDQIVNFLSPAMFHRNARATESGEPVNYTIIGEELQFAPIPDSSYTVQMLYFYAPTFLSDANTTNLFTDNVSDLLLYASLSEAEPYLMNDARIAVWASLYDRGLNALKVADDRGQYSATPMAMTVARR